MLQIDWKMVKTTVYDFIKRCCSTAKRYGMHVLGSAIGAVSIGAVTCTSPSDLGAIHTSELDRSETDLIPKRSECERSNEN